MKCPACGVPAKVTHTKALGDTVKRRHQCLAPTCGARFNTIEVIVVEQKFDVPPELGDPN